MNIYYQIEFTTKLGKERAYVTERDLLDYNNPLRNFDEVKNNYATITYNGQNYYSATGAHIDGYLNNWKLENSIDISEDNWNIMGGITAVISGNTYTDESMGVYSGKLPMPTIQKRKKNYHKTFAEIDTTKSSPSTALAFSTFLIDAIPTFLSGAYSKVTLNVELQSYGKEQKIVIRVGSPIELTQLAKYSGQTIKMSTLLLENSTPLELIEMDKIVDKRIRHLFPELTGDKLYSMDLSFASIEDCSENGYGYYIIIDKGLNVYVQPIFHNGTSFPVYYDGKFIFDAVHSFGMELLQLDEDSANGFLTLLENNGFHIDGFTNENTTSQQIKEGVYRYTLGEYLSELQVTKLDNEIICYWGAWLRYGESASVEDFQFKWIDGQYDYEVTGLRTNQLYNVNITIKNDSIIITMKNIEGKTYSPDGKECEQFQAEYKYIEM